MTLIIVGGFIAILLFTIFVGAMIRVYSQGEKDVDEDSKQGNDFY